MSFNSNIRYKLIIGKLLGIIYVPLNINYPPTIIDYAYPIPVIFTYFYILLIFPKIILLLNDVSKEEEFIFAVWFFMAHCICVTIIKWIYCLTQRSKLQKFMIDLNQQLIKFENVQLIKKSINNWIFGIIIITYIAIELLFNMYSQDTFWFFYLYALSLEIANFEQYFIYTVNNEIYTIIKQINVRIASNKPRKTLLKGTYDDYKRMLLFAEEVNKMFGFLLLCSISVTGTGLISVCYKFEIIYRKIINKDINCLDFSNLNYLIAICIRLYFTVYNWNIILVEVFNMYLLNLL